MLRMMTIYIHSASLSIELGGVMLNVMKRIHE